jgi:hypothetical protein
MNYDAARDLIKTGDLIAVRRRTGFLAIATRLVTRSPYTHTGIAIWCEGRLMLAQETGGGCNIVPLSQEAEYDFDVLDCPVDSHLVESWIWTLLGTRIPYGFVDLARIAAHILFFIPLPKEDGADLVCSALSALIYKKAGWAPVNLPSIPWPAVVVSAIGTPVRIEVRTS